MTDTDRMVAWLREAMDAAQRSAEAACEGGQGRWRQEDAGRMPGFIVGDHEGYHVAYDEGYPTLEQATHIVLNDPAAVLRRIAADRKMLDECMAAFDWDNWGAASLARTVIRNLAEGWGWTEETTS